jgi:hypothetical protein
MMNITDFIRELEAIRASQGDLEVWQGDYNTTLCCVKPADVPVIRELAVLTPKERNNRYVLGFRDASKHSGKFIVVVGR